MPIDRLATIDTTEAAVAKVLTGVPLAHAASHVGMSAAELADAVEVYRQAGRRALDRTNPSWWQVYIRFADWDLAEQAATDNLVPLLDQAEANGLISTWWFIRKHPCWRLRLRPGPSGTSMTADLSPALDRLVAEGKIDAWWPGLYEAETAAFGGGAGIDIAHDLFCADSRALINTLRGDVLTLGRREMSLLLCGTLMRAAGLEWYEQGDVWHRISQERPLPGDLPLGKLATMADEVKRLLLTDTRVDGPLLAESGPLIAAAGWFAAFQQAGRALGAAARDGTLLRGLREVTGYQVIFHWNRLGLQARVQSIMAAAARTAILDDGSRR